MQVDRLDTDDPPPSITHEPGVPDALIEPDPRSCVDIDAADIPVSFEKNQTYVIVNLQGYVTQIYPLD